MKTRELIRRLMEADPSGDMEVSVGKTDIHFVGQRPAYWDGCYEVLKRDPELEGRCYSIVGGEIRGRGSHIFIETHSIRDMLWDEPEYPVTFDDGVNEHTKIRVEQWRAEGRKIASETV